MADAMRLAIDPGLLSPLVIGTTGNGNISLDSTTKKYAGILQVPADTWTHLGFLYVSRTGTPPAYYIGLQGIDANGKPDGTYLGGGSPARGSFTPPADTTWNATWQWVALDNSYTTTTGQLLAVVVENSGTPDASNFGRFSANWTNLGVPPLTLPHSLTANTGTWSIANTISAIALRSASARFGFPAQTLYNTSIGTNGNRAALNFTLSSSFFSTFKVKGVRLNVMPPAAASNWKICLWDGTTETQTTGTLDSDAMGVNTGTAAGEFYFTSAPALTAGSVYRVGVERVDAACALCGWQLAASGDLAAFPGGSNFFLSTWNGSAWTDDQTVRPLVELILDDITAPSAGGGGPVLVNGGLVQ